GDEPYQNFVSVVDYSRQWPPATWLILLPVLGPNCDAAQPASRSRNTVPVSVSSRQLASG
ncbi:MAG: hypothetical protein WBQ20_07890, partial [Methyloceanibacter sp.]